jgi:hypothetical protein
VVDINTPALFLEGRKESVIKTPEASADQSDFPSFLQVSRKKMKLVSALREQGNLHLVISFA